MNIKEALLSFADRLYQRLDYQPDDQHRLRDRLAYLLAQEHVDQKAVDEVKFEMVEEERRTFRPYRHRPRTEAINEAYEYIMSLLAELDDPENDTSSIAQRFNVFKRDWVRNKMDAATASSNLFERSYKSKYYA